MKETFYSLLSPVAASLASGWLVLVGCTSAPPARPVSELRRQADHAAISAQAEYRGHNWKTAALLFQRAAERYAMLDDFLAQAAALHNRAQALSQNGDHEAALENYTQALALNRDVDRVDRQTENMAGMARCQAAQGEVTEAIQTLEEAMVMAQKYPRVTATLQNDLGLLLLQRRQPVDEPRIFELLNSARRINQQHHNTTYVAASTLNLGRACLAFGRLADAQDHLERALADFRSAGDPTGLASVHETLGHLCLARGDSGGARRHFELARAKFAFLKDEAGLQRMDMVTRGGTDEPALGATVTGPESPATE